MAIDRLFIKEKIEEGISSLSRVSTKFQEADILNKAIPREEFEFFIGKLGMIVIYSPALRGLLDFEFKSLTFYDFCCYSINP